MHAWQDEKPVAPSLYVNYRRVTLWNHSSSERLTDSGALKKNKFKPMLRRLGATSVLVRFCYFTFAWHRAYAGSFIC